MPGVLLFCLQFVEIIFPIFGLRKNGVDLFESAFRPRGYFLFYLDAGFF
jgi:hypothetical protein